MGGGLMPNVAGGLLTLADVRPVVRAILAPALDGEPAVLDVTEAVDPPCVVVGWGEPWLEPFGQSPTLHARLQLTCVGGRMDPGPGVEAVEAVVDYVIRRLAQDSWPWLPLGSSAPRAMTVAGVNYLAAEVHYRIPVGVG